MSRELDNGYTVPDDYDGKCDYGQHKVEDNQFPVREDVDNYLIVCNECYETFYKEECITLENGSKVRFLPRKDFSKLKGMS